MKGSHLFLSVVTASASALAQNPTLIVDPAIIPGQALQSALIGLPGQPYASLVDLFGGPRRVLGQTLFLSLTPSMVVLDTGVLPNSGFRFLSTPTPANALTGMPLYFQAVTLDVAAANGLFRASDGESTVLYATPHVFVDKFVDAAAQGFTGTFDRAVLGRVQGGPVAVRTVVIPATGGVPFGQPVAGALNPFGVRLQVVLRAADLGASGRPEAITAIRWRPFPGMPVLDETYQRLAIDISHSNVVPDYTLDPFSALPQFPNSGLSFTFASNPKQNETPQRFYDGVYAIRAANVRPDGYLDYPSGGGSFPYNGFDSVLIDFKMSPSPGTGHNGGFVYLMVLSSPQPYSRVHNAGSAVQSVDPHAVLQASNGGNELPDTQIEIASVATEAVSPWRQAAVARPDYDDAFLAHSLPFATGLLIEYQGSNDPRQGPSTPWTSRADFVDGFPFLRYRLSFVGNPSTRTVPSVDAVVIGYR